MSPDDKTSAILALADLLHLATCVGNPAPVVSRLRKWMKTPPQPGDLVVEQSTKYLAEDHKRRVGVFLRHVDRQVCEHEVQDSALGEPCTKCSDYDLFRVEYTEIELLDSPCNNPECSDIKCIHRVRWSNANFLRFPITPAQRGSCK